MRSERLSSAACGSHMERLHASELLSTSQGAPSSPSTSQLNVIRLAFTRIGSSSLEHFPEKLAPDATRGRTPVFRRKCHHYEVWLAPCACGAAAVVKKSFSRARRGPGACAGIMCTASIRDRKSVV